MNILAINWRCIKNPEKGGAEVHFHEIFKRIVKLGHNVTLVAHRFKNAPPEETIDGINIIRIGNKFLFDKQFKKYYNKNLISKNFDLVVDDISKIPLFTPLYIIKPLVGILHHIHGDSLYKEIPFPLAYYIIKQERKIPRYYRNTPIFTVSQSTKNELSELGQPEDKIDILYNAIDHDLFSAAKIPKEKTPLIAYVGRIKKYKNISAILDAVEILKNRIPDIKFIIGGEGDFLPELKKHVAQKKLDQWIEFKGYVSEEEKAEILGRAWIFVTMPLKEGWGITVIEANAMGTPAIGSDVHGLRDSIKNKETGILVPLDNPPALANEILDLINNQDRLDSLSKSALEWSKNFNWDISAEHFLKKVYEWYPQLEKG